MESTQEEHAGQEARRERRKKENIFSSYSSIDPRAHSSMDAGDDVSSAVSSMCWVCSSHPDPFSAAASSAPAQRIFMRIARDFGHSRCARRRPCSRARAADRSPRAAAPRASRSRRVHPRHLRSGGAVSRKRSYSRRGEPAPAEFGSCTILTASNWPDVCRWSIRQDFQFYRRAVAVGTHSTTSRTSRPRRRFWVSWEGSPP